jgi:hypothetical protein
MSIYLEVERLDVPQQYEDEDDDQHQPQAAHGTVTPAAAVWENGQGQDKNDY